MPWKLPFWSLSHPLHSWVNTVWYGVTAISLWWQNLIDIWIMKNPHQRGKNKRRTKCGLKSCLERVSHMTLNHNGILIKQHITEETMNQMMILCWLLSHSWLSNTCTSSTVQVDAPRRSHRYSRWMCCDNVLTFPLWAWSGLVIVPNCWNFKTKAFTAEVMWSPAAHASLWRDLSATPSLATPA